MPVIVLVGSASGYADQLASHFGSRYHVAVLTGPYQSVRSLLSNQSDDCLYIVPGLSKPERYEIFCLARKSAQQFVSVACSSADGLAPGDKNVLVLEQFDAARMEAELGRSRLVNTSANKRSKGVSLRGLGELKVMINRVNEELLASSGPIHCVLKGCEDRLVRMQSLGLSGAPEELEACYRKMIGAELADKGISRP